MKKFSAVSHLMLQTRLKAIMAFVVIVTILPFSTVLAKDYFTITNGNWEDATTWKDGKAPGNPITNSDNIFISHNITVGNMLVNNGASINILAPNGNLVGAQLELKGDATIDIAPGTSVTFDNIGTVSNSSTNTDPIIINKDNVSPLPVSWVSFKGKASEKGNHLNWTTATEKNNDRFEIQKSLDGKNFNSIGEVKPASGNSNTIRSYSFTDHNASGEVSYYRLKQVDFDGSETLSSIIAVRNSQSVHVSVYPNLVADFMEIQLPKELATEQNFEIVNVKGTVVKKFSASTTNSINVEDLTPGIYFVKISGLGNNNQTRFVKL